MDDNRFDKIKKYFNVSDKMNIATVKPLASHAVHIEQVLPMFHLPAPKTHPYAACILPLTPGGCLNLWLIAANILAWVLIIHVLHRIFA